MQQIYSATAKVDMTFGLPDLSSALRQIQSQYDSIAAKNLQVWCNSAAAMCSDSGGFIFYGISKVQKHAHPKEMWETL